MTLYMIQNRRDPVTEERHTISVDDDVEMPNIWCINFMNMQLVEGKLIGVHDDGDYCVTLDMADNDAWAVPEYNIYYSKHSAEKGLFTAHLKYERD